MVILNLSFAYPKLGLLNCKNDPAIDKKEEYSGHGALEIATGENLKGQFKVNSPFYKFTFFNKLYRFLLLCMVKFIVLIYIVIVNHSYFDL